MKSLIIKDLAITADLDRAAMASVHGGHGSGSYGGMYQDCFKGMPSYGGPAFSLNQNDFKFDATQQLGQSQNTIVNNGNNVAFASGITANVQPHQTGHNTINFG